MIFAQRYRNGLALTDPWWTGLDSDRAYYHTPREWYRWCRWCEELAAYPSWKSAHHADEHHRCDPSYRPGPAPVAKPTKGWTSREDRILLAHPHDQWEELLPGRSWTAISARVFRLRKHGFTVKAGPVGKPRNPVQPKPRKPSEPCGYEGCGKTVHGHGLCAGHAAQRRRGENLRPLRQRRAAA